MPSSESAAPLSRARGSAATQSSKSSSFQSELRNDTDPSTVVQATAAQIIGDIIGDQATAIDDVQSDKAKDDGATPLLVAS